MAKFIFLVVFFTIVSLIVLFGAGYGIHFLFKDWLERTRKWDKEDSQK